MLNSDGNAVNAFASGNTV